MDAAQADEDLFISAITLAEIRRGLLERPTGRKRRELEDWFSGRNGPSALFYGRILPSTRRLACMGEAHG